MFTLIQHALASFPIAHGLNTCQYFYCNSSRWAHDLLWAVDHCIGFFTFMWVLHRT